MKDQDSQEQEPISEIIANLLCSRLTSKLPKSELTSLISETKEIVEKKDQTPINKAACPSEPQIEQQVNKLKNSVDYIEYKCREIERSLRASGRHVRLERRERVFRDRSPLGIFCGEDRPMYRGLRPVSSSLAVTRSLTAPIRRSHHNPWFDNYFS
jgi:hypothetical protein